MKVPAERGTMEQAADPASRPPEDVERFAKLLLVAHKAA